MKKIERDSDHAWFNEHIGAFVAGGLDSAESERFGAHRDGCGDCAARLEKIVSVDTAMRDAVSGLEPAGHLDARIIQSLRKEDLRRSRFSPFFRNAVAACAALVLCGFVGYQIDSLQHKHGLLQTANLRDDKVVMVTELARAQKRDRDVSMEAPKSDDKTIKTPDEMTREFNDRYKTEIDRLTAGGKLQATPASTDPTSKESSDIVVPPDILAKAELGDHFETIDPDKPDSHSALGNPDAKMFHSNSGVTSSGGGGDAGGDGGSLDDVIGVGSATSPGSGGGFGGGTGQGVVAGSGKGSFGERNGGGRKLMVKRHGGAEENKQADGKQNETFYSYKDQSPAANTKESHFAPTQLDKLASTDAKEAAREDKQENQQQQSAYKLGLANGGNLKADGDKPEPPAPNVEKASPRYIIRNGEMEFEVDSFDSAYIQISKIAAEESGLIATTNSEKLANGKVRGSVTLRVPPDHLDVLVLKLRALGELKNQRITSQDVSKLYTDTESELRAARAMETRLLDIIKTGKGDVSDLLKAEKELAVWREKIEKQEGELRYYNNLISMSTLTLTLAERDVKSPTSATEQQTVSTGIETDDVEKAYNDALKAIADVKGRVTGSELKKYDAGQFGASITCEVPPESAGQLQDRLKQLGRIARLNIEHKQSTLGGTGAPTVKIERKETQFVISLYNLANVAPRETVHVNLAAGDAESAYHAILARIEKADGRVLSSSLNREKPEQTSATVNFEIKSADAEAVQNDVRAAGEVMQLTVTENPDTNNVTQAKKGFVVQVFALSQVAPRETSQLQIAATQVPDAYAKLVEAVRAAKGRMLVSQLDEKDRQNVTGRLEFEVARSDVAALDKVLSSLGDTYSNTVDRSSDTANTIDVKKRFTVSLFNADRLAPREITTLAIELNDVDKAATEIAALAQAAGGRTVESHVSKDRSGRVVGKVVIELPLTKGTETVSQIRGLGTLRMIEASRNSQVPEGALSRARIDVTLANADVIVPDDRGLGSALRSSVSTTVTGLLWSLQLIIIGVCFVGPWALMAWLLIRWYRRSAAKA